MARIYNREKTTIFRIADEIASSERARVNWKLFFFVAALAGDIYLAAM